MIPLALACIAIAGGADRITAGDLGFDGPAASTSVALAPAPGVQRVFRAAELQRIAARLQAAAPEKDVCVERSTAPLDRDSLMEAMQRQLPEARIELIDYSRFNVPEGDLEFKLSDLRETPAGGFWTGAVLYGGGRRFTIWAKVKVRISVPRVVAAEPLKPGPIHASQLRLEIREDFPSADSPASIEEAAGLRLRRSVPAGTVIQKQWLDRSMDIARGDTVRVEVHSGAAVLSFEGEAVTAGSIGQDISILNPSSKKRFQARVDGKGRASIGRPSL